MNFFNNINGLSTGLPTTEHQRPEVSTLQVHLSADWRVYQKNTQPLITVMVTAIYVSLVVIYGRISFDSPLPIAEQKYLRSP